MFFVLAGSQTKSDWKLLRFFIELGWISYIPYLYGNVYNLLPISRIDADVFFEIVVILQKILDALKNIYTYVQNRELTVYLGKPIQLQ